MADKFMEWLVVLVSGGVLLLIWGLLAAFALAILLVPVALVWALYNVGVWFGG